jgi:hypothetical protein
MEEFTYPGNELEDFQEATRWKMYFTSRILKMIGEQEVLLEVGAGIGANSTYLSKHADCYYGVEPDIKLVEMAQKNHPTHRFSVGYLENFTRPANKQICLMYIDVFEHIQDDLTEMKKIEEFLEPNELLVLIVPAHMILFSTFDRAVGHWRRYKKADLHSLSGDMFRIIHIEELDFLGFLLSLSSRLLRPNKLPSKTNIRTWDRLIPLSQLIDFLIQRRLGKTIFCVMQKK